MSYPPIELTLKLVLSRITAELVWVCAWFLSVIFLSASSREDPAPRRDGTGAPTGEDGASGRGPQYPHGRGPPAPSGSVSPNPIHPLNKTKTIKAYITQNICLLHLLVAKT